MHFSHPPKMDGAKFNGHVCTSFDRLGNREIAQICKAPEVIFLMIITIQFAHKIPFKNNLARTEKNVPESLEVEEETV